MLGRSQKSGQFDRSGSPMKHQVFATRGMSDGCGSGFGENTRNADAAATLASPLILMVRFGSRAVFVVLGTQGGRAMRMFGDRVIGAD